MGREPNSFERCEEGGFHQYALPEQTSVCGWIARILCCPCYALCTCALGNGASGGRSGVGFGGAHNDDPNQSICRKCGLTPSEVRAYVTRPNRSEGTYSPSKGMSISTTPTPSYPSPSPPPGARVKQSRERPPSRLPSPGAPEKTVEDARVGPWLATLPNRSSQFLPAV